MLQLPYLIVSYLWLGNKLCVGCVLTAFATTKEIITQELLSYSQPLDIHERACALIGSLLVSQYQFIYPTSREVARKTLLYRQLLNMSRRALWLAPINKPSAHLHATLVMMSSTQREWVEKSLKTQFYSEIILFISLCPSHWCQRKGIKSIYHNFEKVRTFFLQI